jgi:RimJ/RimL family protein N-acetyltransferase
MADLETERLWIRPLTPADTDAVFQLNQSIGWLDPAQNEAEQRQTIRDYVAWCSMNHAQLARLSQPPYGDRAVALKSSGELVGLCGLVPYVDALGNFPYFGGLAGRATTEMGLFWAIHAAHQGHGYATEVARALIHYALHDLNLHHIIATTEYDNLASQQVMKKAGMRLERNPFPEPPWQQIVGIIENAP